LVARVTSDVETIQQFVQWGGVGLVVGIAQVLLAVAVMAIYRWQLAVLMVASVAFYTVLLIWFQRILRRAHDRVRTTVATSLGTMSESISGLSIVRAHGAEDRTLGRVSRALDDQFHAEYRTGILGASLFSSAELFAGLITALAIGVGVVFGDGWGMSAGTLIAFLFLINLLVEPVQTLVETLDRAQSAAAGLARILDLLDEKVDIPDPGDNGTSLPEGALDVRFTNVRFRYPTGGDVLVDLDAHIESGRRVAVVGETGSGKSTFAKLVTRLLDTTAGTVYIGGVDVRDVPFAGLRSRVAFVPQEGFLFDSTVAENVRYGRPKATDADVLAAFSDMALDDWIASLPNGIYTYVGERGNRLSAGERQLVALVRAWIAAPDLLVLDEATSAVDPSLEVRLRSAIEQLTHGRTSITVAHRLSTAEASDVILVFDAGKLVEQGSHLDLLDLGGVYSGLQDDWASGTQGPDSAPAPVG
jgi:putative ABC transport system ATP-binding protein